MKIKNIYIKNYRIFDELELDFTDSGGNTLSAVLLAGENGCGKTTILNMIERALSDITIHPPFCSMLKITLELTQEQLSIIRTSLDVYKQSGNPMFNMLFDTVNKSAGELTLIYEEVSNIEIRNDFLLFKLLEKVKYQNKTGLKLLYTNKEVDTMVDKEHFSNQIREDIISYYKRTDSESITKDFQAVDKNFPMLSQMFSVENGMIFFKSLNNKVIKLDDLSSGEKQIVYRFFYIKQSCINDGLIIIDEPENSLHPKWQQKAIQLYNQLGGSNQIILATHSPHIISSMPPECLFILTSNNQSSIQAINIGKSKKNTKGLDPNRILLEIMGTPLRDPETQAMIDTLMNFLNAKDYKKPEAIQLVNSLRTMLGTKDPFVMRMEHQLRTLSTQR